MRNLLYKQVSYSIAIIALLLQLAGCATSHRNHYHGADGPPGWNIDVSKIPNAVPKYEPLSRYGNPRSYVVDGHRYYVMKSAKGYDEKGIASWYGMRFHKQKTSSGDPYDVAGMTAAHKTLPLPTFVQVTNLKNGRQVIVKVNDRGPFVSNRLIDLSYVAAKKLGVTAHGTALVEVKAIDPRNPGVVLKQRPKAIMPGRPEIYLQMGAFAVRDNAEHLAAHVRDVTNLPVVIRTKGNLYRVQIGPISDVENTDALSERLSRAGLGRPIVAVQ